MSKPWYEQWFWEGIFALLGGIGGWFGRGRRDRGPSV